MVKHACACALAAAALMAAVPAGAQDKYPSKPLRLVVPFPPGGTTDLVARIVAQKLSEAWGQQVVVDNRAGAGGVVASETVARSAADGYTLLMGSITTHAVNPALYRKLSFDPVRDFTPVSLVVSSPQLLAVNPAVAAKSVKEFIATAKAKPGSMNYGSAGSGSSPHLTFELFKRMAGIDVVHVPYKGTGPAITDLVAGQVQAMITGLPALLPHTKSGRLRALGVTSAGRVASLPDVPTIAESGVAGFDVNSWFGVFVPAGTPKAIVQRMNQEIRRMVENPEVKQRLIDQGADPATNSPEEFARYVKLEMDRWGEVVRSTGTRID